MYKPSPESRQYNLQAFGNYVQSERLKAGLTQAMLAEKAEITQKEISNIEHGKSNIGIISLFKLAYTLHISVDAFLYGLADIDILSQKTNYSDIVEILSPNQFNELLSIINAYLRSHNIPVEVHRKEQETTDGN